MTNALDVEFAEHLRRWGEAGSASPGLVHGLSRNGELAEAELLRLYLDAGERWVTTSRTSGIWQGRRCWLGARPPDEAHGGDLWFDVVEVTVSVLVPRPDAELADFSADEWEVMTSCVGWLAARPVRRWQFLGFASVAGLDLGREIGSSAYAMGVYGHWADRYAVYFGKGLPGWDSWWGAACAFDDDILDAMWPQDIPEIGFRVQEDAVAILGRARALRMNQDPGGSFPMGERFAITDDFWLPGMRFRTEVSTQLGILPPDGEGGCGVSVLARP
ncbi:hypothetical protein [Frankia sp. Cppng1_Ct_nod]|uniref:hypothetical protein n=1 Tax=Frankia sp. Cppng1_Ct_nod TaxID=2897162 RepID=UPI001041ACBA|nr:hypothetical protein [Frankia sp. Cppng1_Ct_nod]